MSAVEHSEPEEEVFDCISILEMTPAASRFDYEPGEKVVVGGAKRNLNKYVEDDGDFVKYAERVACIDLNEPLTDDELTEWCNTEVGKHVLGHYFDHTDPVEEVRD